MDSEMTERIDQTNGTVKWFDPRKGFGFIIGPQGQDVFVHYSKILGDGFRALKDGSSVVYEAEKTPKGWHATTVQHVPADADIVVTATQPDSVEATA